ncbi:MAG: hypothetical protein AB1752_11600 [Candidatus Zixiibacteriota bacterium]
MPKRKPESPKRVIPRRSIQTEWRESSAVERATTVVLLALVAYALLQVAINYPASFYPRYADEGIYALDARVPASIFSDYQKGQVRYAPAKLGYGIPLAASVALAGSNGPMYLSTLLWLATIVLVGYEVLRRFGFLDAVIAVGFLSVSPMFGKYLTEVDPTMEAAFAFALLWVVALRRRFLLTGLCIGLIAFIDFKWAVPAGLAFTAVELFGERARPLKDRAVQVILAGLVAIAAIGLAMLLHRPYARFLSEYVFPHSDLILFAPSAIILYFLAIFGAFPMLLVGAAGLIWRGPRVPTLDCEKKRAVTYALILALVPIAFYSLFGVLKALRFFAVFLPLLAIPAGIGLGGLVRRCADALARFSSAMRTALAGLVALAAMAVVHGGSAGSWHHLRLPAAFPEALARLQQTRTEGGSVSSYNWPVVAYGWPEPFPGAPFAFYGLQTSDRWIATDPALDRATIELRLRLSGDHGSADSAWHHQMGIYLAVTDSLYSLPSDFYSSAYFLSESVPGGASVLHRWLKRESGHANSLTIRRINPQKVEDYKRKIGQPH